MRHDLRNIKKNATWLRDHRKYVTYVRLNDAWRDAICELCDEVDQLETELAEIDDAHNITKLELHELKAENTSLRSLFGGYDFHPTPDQCRDIWNDIMKERKALRSYKDEVGRVSRCHVSVFHATNQKS